MNITRNLDVVRKIQRASLRGESVASRKPLYMERNTFDVCLDLPIYRIFQIRYLEKDISDERLTFVPVHPSTWGDEYENPLLKASYPDPETGGIITLGGVLEDFHALSWTKSQEESEDAWEEFSHGFPAVRVESTPRLLLDGLMDVNDPWFMLRFYVGLVRYEPLEMIKAWIDSSDFTVHLDSLGQGLAGSLMLLQSHLEYEEEVRILCSPLKSSEEDWGLKNLQQTKKTLSTPFDWPGCIKSIVYRSSIEANERQRFSSLLAKHKIVCDESWSCL